MHIEEMENFMDNFLLYTEISHPYVSEDIKMEKFNDDFNYIIIDNLLSDKYYDMLCAKFNTYISRCAGALGKIGDKGQSYDAKIYQMTPADCVEGYDFFVSTQWYNFIRNIFNIELNSYIAYTLHYHEGSSENPSKDGWPHTDLNIVSVLDRPGDALKLTGGCTYPDNTFNKQPHTKKCLRSVALLYYFNNKSPLEEDDGGGTSIFKNYNKDSFIKEIKPINNRLFAFEVTPKSYHAFKGAKFNRSAMVQWFHSSPSYILKRNFELFKTERLRANRTFFEYWQNDNAWHADRDPDYSKYFNIPYSQLIKL